MDAEVGENCPHFPRIARISLLVGVDLHQPWNASTARDDAFLRCDVFDTPSLECKHSPRGCISDFEMPNTSTAREDAFLMVFGIYYTLP